jgi:hypothetical protein
MDFVHDQLATGKKLRVLTVIDTFSRYVPVLDPRHSSAGVAWLWGIGTQIFCQLRNSRPPGIRRGIWSRRIFRSIP